MDDTPRLSKIVSGAQTGVDRAALDVALALGFPCGGWVPKGRRAEDGRVPASYPVRETGGRGYPERTLLNVRDSDATLILTRGEPKGGTALTVDYALNLERPNMVVDLLGPTTPEQVRKWLEENDVVVLNIAGPRESSSPGIYDQAAGFLKALLG
jgi:hypothetical protein